MHAFSYGAALQKIPGAQLGYSTPTKAGAEGAKRFSSQFFLRRKPLTRWMRSSAREQPPPGVHRAGRWPNAMCFRKAIATNLEDAKVTIDACAKAGVKLQIAFPSLSEPVRR